MLRNQTRLSSNIARILLILALVFALFMASVPHPPQVPGGPSDKLQHTVAFVVLTVLASLAYPAISRLIILSGLVFFGALIEIVQSIPILMRDPSLSDWLVDCAAISGTIFVIAAAERIQSAFGTHDIE